MTLTLNEKEKLLEKAKKTIKDISNIKIRETISINIEPKYYDNNSRYARNGFKYYYSGSISLYCEDIKKCIEELEKYITDTKDKNVISPYISSYSINALLDFIYYKDYILKQVDLKNSETRNELNSLLS